MTGEGSLIFPVDFWGIENKLVIEVKYSGILSYLAYF